MQLRQHGGYQHLAIQPQAAQLLNTGFGFLYPAGDIPHRPASLWILVVATARASALETENIARTGEMRSIPRPGDVCFRSPPQQYPDYRNELASDRVRGVSASHPKPQHGRFSHGSQHDVFNRCRSPWPLDYRAAARGGGGSSSSGSTDGSTSSSSSGGGSTGSSSSSSSSSSTSSSSTSSSSTSSSSTSSSSTSSGGSGSVSYLQFNNFQSANVVIGQSYFTSGLSNQGGSADANTLSYPFGQAIATPDGLLYIADTNNNRILVFNGIPDTNNPVCLHGLRPTGLHNHHGQYRWHHHGKRVRARRPGD